MLKRIVEDKDGNILEEKEFTKDEIKDVKSQDNKKEKRKDRSAPKKPK